MKHKDTKENKKYKTKLDEWIGETAQKIYNKIGIAGTILFSLILFIFSIISFVRLISNNFWKWFNFDLSDKNEVGDALGGLTAPFIGILGAFFTFIAFWVQYKFNQKQSKFYQNDKLDRKVDETNKLIEMIIIKDDTIFTHNRVTAFGACQKAFLQIDKKFKNNQLPINDTTFSIIVNNITSAYLTFEGITDTKEDVHPKVELYLRSQLIELNALRKILFYFLKEIRNYSIDKDEKIEIIESFMQKFALLNNKFYSKIGFIYFTAFNDKYKAASKRNTAQDLLIIEDITARMINEDENECLKYLSGKVVKSYL